MDFNEYLNKVFPELSVRKRKHMGPATNFAKYLGIRGGYFFYKLGISANLLDVICLFLAVVGFYFLSLAASGHKFLPILGILILFFHVWIDFVDGSLAKAMDSSSTIGHYLDSLGVDSDRYVLLVMLGFLSGKLIFVIGNSFAA